MRFSDQTRIEFRKDLWPNSTWRQKVFIVIFGTDTHAGKKFDVALLWAILLSIGVVMLESVDAIRTEYGQWLKIAEWAFTILFTIEYLARIISISKPWYYASSFYGIIDLVSVIPTYLALFFTGGQYLLVIRALRLLRIFRILKLTRYTGEASTLLTALQASRHKITVFLGAVFTIVVIMGTMMYLIEGGDNGFTSIPRSIYWAIVTLTTVGYGDIAPQTILGQTLASVIMIMGYAIIAVPTGIVTAELTYGQKNNGKKCEHCGCKSHPDNAKFCFKCGKKLNQGKSKK